MGIAIIVDADADPTLPPLLPSAGVTGYSGRWLANALSGADGTAVSNLPALVGGTTRDLKQATSTAQPTLRVSGAEKWLSFDGTSDVLAQSAAVPAWLTTAMVFRVDAATTTQPIYTGSTGNFTAMGGTSFINVNAGSGGGGAQVSSSAAVSRSAWHVLVVVQGGASSIVAVDSTKGTGTLGPNAANLLSLGISTTATFGQISVAEVVTWDTALTSGQVDLVVAALKAGHPSLLP